MNRKIFASLLTAAAMAVAAPAVYAQFICYDSYVTMSGTCPDSCGRGPDCPCTTCNNTDLQ